MSRWKCISHGPYRAVNFDRYTILCTEGILTVRMRASMGHITLYFGGGGTGVSDFVTSLA
jgi:hypothetical protein